MLTRRDVASIAWYCALFAAVVSWASLRRGGPEPIRPAVSEQIGAFHDANDDQAVLRRVVRHMVTQ